MSCTVLVGSQWGDEGKGKIIDVLTENVDVVVRYQGGNNAGHTVEIEDEVPPEHYKAVAQVIGFVMRQKKRYRF